ncbi:kinase-like protein [Glonium stellatum]|uniref:Kinase-like protein n=1 Tax=Glonium stellatum TaxID=574774 RepID=A0A8E2EPJ9_9PEZI|nr:kinase-like protein [Glonium stellatum]
MNTSYSTEGSLQMWISLPSAPNSSSRGDGSVASFVTTRTSLSAASFRTAQSRIASRNTSLVTGGHTHPNPSKWLEYLQEKSLIPTLDEEKNWSGRGQHVEYESHEASLIPLVSEGVLGFSATALVESVRCRRIRLARKTVKCGYRIKREDAIKEVEHLQRLRHYHLIQVIGTYVMGRDLAILLYPVADYNLESFIDSILDEQPQTGRRVASMCFFFGCLSNALQYLHSNITRHMDIKPKNLLVRDISRKDDRFAIRYNIYLADFGISRSYSSYDASETDSATSFTRTYSAPEVILQEKRGLSADIFSLGCVFLEILAVIAFYWGDPNEMKIFRENRTTNIDGDQSYQANIPALRSWLDHVVGVYRDRLVSAFTDLTQDQPTKSLHETDTLLDLLPKMLDADPSLRPTAAALATCTSHLCCPRCHSEPEALEAAEECI